MISGIVDQTVIGENNTLPTTETTFIVDVAFIVLAALLLRQLIIIVIITIPTDAHAIGHIPQITFFTVPTTIAGFVLGKVVVRQFTVSVDVESYFILGVIPAIFVDGRIIPLVGRKPIIIFGLGIPGFWLELPA